MFHLVLKLIRFMVEASETPVKYQEIFQEEEHYEDIHSACFA
jgi:hypothetical protein